MRRNFYFKEPVLRMLEEQAVLMIFDMNGLILDDEGVQRESVNCVLKPFCIELSKQEWAEDCVGRRADVYLRSKLAQKSRAVDEQLISELVTEKNRRYHEMISRQVQKLVRPGVRDILRFFFREEAVRLALATSALPSEVNVILGERGLKMKELFHFIITGADVSRGKPDPQIYELLLRRSGIPPSRALVFEDSEQGVSASFGAGIPSIAVPNRYTAHQDFSHAHCLLDNLTRDARIIQRGSLINER